MPPGGGRGLTLEILRAALRDRRVCVCVCVCVCGGDGAIHTFWHVFDRQAAWRRRGLGGDRVTGSDKVSIRLFCRLINLFRSGISLAANLVGYLNQL